MVRLTKTAGRVYANTGLCNNSFRPVVDPLYIFTAHLAFRAILVQLAFFLARPALSIVAALAFGAVLVRLALARPALSIVAALAFGAVLVRLALARPALSIVAALAFRTVLVGLARARPALAVHAALTFRTVLVGLARARPALVVDAALIWRTANRRLLGAAASRWRATDAARPLSLAALFAFRTATLATRHAITSRRLCQLQNS
jgi:hypothetical protein